MLRNKPLTIDSKDIQRIHFVGVKGVGLTALAIWAKQRGILVSGSDIDEEFPTDRMLRAFNIPVTLGFHPDHIKNPDLVIVTGAHKGLQNIEAKTAQAKGIHTILHGEALGTIMGFYTGIAVAGCHGKTTTASLIAHLLYYAGKDPSYAIGCGEIHSLGAPGRAGDGPYFVAESDEYINGPPDDRRPKFLFLHPYTAVITNIEFDHPDAYKSLEAVEKSFVKFSLNVEKDGIIVAGIDNPSVKKILPTFKRKVLTYGFDLDADFVIDKIDYAEKKTMFIIQDNLGKRRKLTIQIPGKHNIQNATAAAIVANSLGISWTNISTYLQKFTGTKRRFEYIGRLGGALFFDDYAHHPTEVKATLLGARAWFPKNRIISIFQPHTYSRTKALYEHFCRAFTSSDIVLLADIYASAREARDPTISAEKIATSMKKYHRNVFFTPDKYSVMTFLSQNLKKKDIIITMGAGDIYTWHEDFKKHLP